MASSNPSSNPSNNTNPQGASARFVQVYSSMGMGHYTYEVTCGACAAQSQLTETYATGQALPSDLAVQCGCGWSGTLPRPQMTPGRLYMNIPPNGGVVNIPVGSANAAAMQQYLAGALAGIRGTADTTDNAASMEEDRYLGRRMALYDALSEVSEGAEERIRDAVASEMWDMAGWRRYEALQAAHERLFSALGERRIGERRVDQEALEEALEEVVYWLMACYDAATWWD